MKQMNFIDGNEKSFWKTLKSGKFAKMVKEESRGESLGCASDVFNILKPLYAKEADVEQMYFIFLDCKNRVITLEKLFTGSINCSAIYPREVIKKVLKEKASAVVISHNHPSGDPTPSKEDHALTRKMALALYSVDVMLLDHIIVGRTYYSFSDYGFMEKIKKEMEGFLYNRN